MSASPLALFTTFSVFALALSGIISLDCREATARGILKMGQTQPELAEGAAAPPEMPRFVFQPLEALHAAKI